jgi:thiamine biosynthesis lipoprotein
MHTVRVELADPARLRAARRAADREVAAARTALTRELPRAQLATGRPARVSSLLADLVAAALDAARRTAGDVDPTVGAALLRLRYATSRPWLPVCGSAVGEQPRPVPGWREVDLDGQWLTVPPAVLLDLGATAPARTAERCAELVAARYGTGALVDIDGDVATAGAAPPGGWRAGTLPAGRALGTSRRPVLDPATGRLVSRRWRAVTVEAATCVTASAFATAVAIRRDTTLPDGATAMVESVAA